MLKNHCRETQQISSIFTSKQLTAAAAIMFATNYRNPIGLQALEWLRRGKNLQKSWDTARAIICTSSIIQANTPCVPPKTLRNLCSYISTGYYSRP